VDERGQKEPFLLFLTILTNCLTSMVRMVRIWVEYG
jgi:hypothetical protein